MIKDEPIKFYSDFQRNWAALIEPLRRGGYTIESTEMLSIHGDAPKSFIRIKEYVPGRATRRVSHWPAYIAKVGSKSYPNESITEQLLTRVGQLMGVRIASSELRMVGRQVRFLSRYFLRPRKDSLVHGIEIFKRHLDDEMVEAIAAARKEPEFYTFQTVGAAMADSFPVRHERLMGDMVEMLAFDAIVGNNDRHPANWGIIVPIGVGGEPRFSPVFDTARALFWNLSEERLVRFVRDPHLLKNYIDRSRPQIGWNGSGVVSHFELVAAIYQDYPLYRASLQRFSRDGLLQGSAELVENEFGLLMSPLRRSLIKDCLSRRHARFREVVGAG
jgi:hypothetical protein